MAIFYKKNILTELGFSHVWNNQGTFNSASLVKCIKSKLKERFVLYWNKRMAYIDGTDKLRTYKLIKQAFELEQYLEIIPDRKQRKSITALRCFKLSAGGILGTRKRKGYVQHVMLSMMKFISFVSVLNISLFVQRCILTLT